jgi:Arc/MetJ-type ribon-helix-helix transcriptional regulator
MRNAVTISLPDAVYKEVQKEVKKGKFASVSEYIRYVLREHQINKAVKELHKMKKEFEAGKGIEFTVADMDSW